MLLSGTEAVTTSGESKPDEVSEIPAADPLKIEFKTGKEPTSSDILGPDLSGHVANSPYINLESIKEEALSPPYGGERIEYSNRSIGVFSLALWLLGGLITFAGTFSLSFGRKIEGIDAQGFISQLRQLNVSSAKMNVSRNWGKKKDATWFVIMGLCSIIAGFIDWLIL